MSELLRKVKLNLILEHDRDDELLRHYISAAVAYTERYQHKKSGSLLKSKGRIPATTEQAIIMMASHFYESRDGGTGGFFADSVGAAQQVRSVVDSLLMLDVTWRF